MKSSARILSLLVLVLILFVFKTIFFCNCVYMQRWGLGCTPQLHVEEVRDLWGVSPLSILKWVPESTFSS